MHKNAIDLNILHLLHKSTQVVLMQGLPRVDCSLAAWVGNSEISLTSASPQDILRLSK